MLLDMGFQNLVEEIARALVTWWPSFRFIVRVPYTYKWTVEYEWLVESFVFSIWQVDLQNYFTHRHFCLSLGYLSWFLINYIYLSSRCMFYLFSISWIVMWKTIIKLSYWYIYTLNEMLMFFHCSWRRIHRTDNLLQVLEFRFCPWTSYHLNTLSSPKPHIRWRLSIFDRYWDFHFPRNYGNVS